MDRADDGWVKEFTNGDRDSSDGANEGTFDGKFDGAF